jgi:hypothetical protein
MARYPALERFAACHGLRILTVEALADFRRDQIPKLNEKAR